MVAQRAITRIQDADDFTGSPSSNNGLLWNGSAWAPTAISEAKLSITDVTTGNVSSTAHGFTPKSPADATKFLNGATTPAYAQPKDSDLAVTDVTTNNVTSTAHGFAPKSAADATKFLNSATTPAYAQVKDSDLALTDITTNNVSTSAHGFAPKAPNDSTKFLDGTGAYSVPAGSGGGIKQMPVPLTTSDSSSNGYPALTTNNGFTNVRRIVPAFTHGVDGSWEGQVTIPDTYASGGSITLSWVVNATANAVRWIVSTAVVASAVTENTAYTAETAQNITVPGTALLRKDTAFTLSTTLVAGLTLNVKVQRNGFNGGDTCTVDALLLDCVLRWT